MHGMVWCVRNCFHLLFFFFYVSYHENENNEQVLLFITTEAATALRRPCVEHAWYCCAVVTAHSLSITHTHWHAHSLTRSFARMPSALRQTEQYSDKYARLFAQTGARARERANGRTRDVSYALALSTKTDVRCVCVNHIRCSVLNVTFLGTPRAIGCQFTHSFIHLQCLFLLWCCVCFCLLRFVLVSSVWTYTHTRAHTCTYAYLMCT